MPLQSGTPYDFRFYEIQTPMNIEGNIGSIIMEFSTNFRNKKKYILSELTYPSFEANPFSGTTMLCNKLDNWPVGKFGNIDCLMTVVFPYTNYPIVAIRVDFKNVANDELTALHPFCQAFMKNNVGAILIPTQQQLTCSRKDIDATHPSLFISGFTYTQGHSLNIAFKARAADLDLIKVDVSLQTYYQKVYSPMHIEADLGFSISAYLDTLSKSFFIKALLNRQK